MKHLANITILLTLVSSTFAQDQDWETYFEKSNYLETPRYAETVEYCQRLAGASPILHFTSFGKSSQGRELPLLILDKDGYTDPESIRKADRSIILAEACIHAGEPDGKDAGLLLLRDIVIRGLFQNYLDSVSLIFVPIYNVDGHERFGPFNRINQNGPTEMGWRTNAANLNLNRDWLKADAPETQAMLKLWNTWNPDFFIDMHTTNGADYQYVITWMLETYGNLYKPLSDWCVEEFTHNMEHHFDSVGILTHRYISFRRWIDPESGLNTYVSDPKLSTGYAAIRNRPGLLVETHMLKDYKSRVEATYQMLLASFDAVYHDNSQLRTLNKAADEYAQSKEFRARPFPLKFKTTESYREVEFLGKEMIKVKSDVSGITYTAYGDKNVMHTMKLYDEIVADRVVSLPDYYILAPEWTEVTHRLDLHGINYQVLEEQDTFRIETYKFKNPQWRRSPFEGRITLDVEYETINIEKVYPKGSILIPVAQPKSRIIAHILEPAAPDSYVFWGFFNTVMEQKEYAEFYVMEPLAAQMLEEDPALKAEFEERMKDKSFAKNPWAIINWFYARSPWWDVRKDVYPVGRLFNDQITK